MTEVAGVEALGAGTGPAEANGAGERAGRAEAEQLREPGPSPSAVAPAGGPARSVEVAGLAARVEVVQALATEALARAGAVGEAREALGALLEAVRAVSDRVDDLYGQVAALQRVAPVAAWPDPGEQLGAWVDGWLVPTFADYRAVLDGWRDNPAVVSELAAAHEAYRQVFTDQASGFDRMSWHAMMLSTVDRVRAHAQQAPGSALTTLLAARQETWG